MPDRERVNYTLLPATAALLRRTGNASAYVDDVVRERWAAWQEALEILRARGWEAPEIGTAADALNGLRSREQTAVALALANAREHADEQGVPAKRWAKLVEQVVADPMLWWALLVASAEAWARNDAFAAALERG